MNVKKNRSNAKPQNIKARISSAKNPKHGSGYRLWQPTKASRRPMIGATSAKLGTLSRQHDSKKWQLQLQLVRNHRAAAEFKCPKHPVGYLAVKNLCKHSPLH